MASQSTVIWGAVVQWQAAGQSATAIQGAGAAGISWSDVSRAPEPGLPPARGVTRVQGGRERGVRGFLADGCWILVWP